VHSLSSEKTVEPAAPGVIMKVNRNFLCYKEKEISGEKKMEGCQWSQKRGGYLIKNLGVPTKKGCKFSSKGISKKPGAIRDGEELQGGGEKIESFVCVGGRQQVHSL